MFSDSTVLVTGGTGSFGHAFVPMTLARFPLKADDKTSAAFHGQALVVAARLALAAKDRAAADASLRRVCADN